MSREWDEDYANRTLEKYALTRPKACAIIAPGPSVKLWQEACTKGLDDAYSCRIAVCHGVLAVKDPDWFVLADENTFNDPEIERYVIDNQLKSRSHLCGPIAYQNHDYVERGWPELCVPWEAMGLDTKNFSSTVAILLALKMRYRLVDCYGMDMGGIHGIGLKCEYADDHWAKERKCLDAIVTAQKQMPVEVRAKIRRITLKGVYDEC